MKTFISLLRGINVSGQKKILMKDLKTLYEQLGFSNVQTYIQSGNVVFDYEATNPKKLEKMILSKIQDHYGFDVPNLILYSSDIEDALKNNPFQDIEKVYYVFLAELPHQENIDILNAISFEGEFFELKEKVIYFHCTNGVGNAKMSTNFFERKLKVSATARNFNTTKKLLEMASPN